MVFLNDEELSSAIVGGLNTAVQYVMEEILKRNDKAIQVHVYQKYVPKVYQVTGDFVNAWDIKTASGSKTVDGEFYFEPNEIGVNPNADPPQHADVDGNSVAQYMADLIYESDMGCIQRPVRRNAWKVVDKWLSVNNLSTLFQRGMRRAGLKFVKGNGAPTKTTE